MDNMVVFIDETDKEWKPDRIFKPDNGEFEWLGQD